MENYGQKESQRERGIENVQSDSLASGERRIQKSGSVYGDVSLAVSRFDWTEEGRSLLARLLGGILQQLLTTEKQRLNEVKECVEWYEREQSIVESRIKEIEQLQKLAGQAQLEPDKSENLEMTEEE